MALLTLSKHAGIGGGIKHSPEDFVVKEITNEGKILQPDTRYDSKALGAEEAADGKHITFVLQKRDWNTVDALLAIAKKMGHGRKSTAYCGSKDKKSVSVQLASVFHTTPFDLGTIRISGISINGQWRSNGVALGQELGNAFEVVVRGAERPENAEAILSELDGKMPNYFGAQRFGERGNNVAVGLAILSGDFEGAVMEYLTGSGAERNEKVREARVRLKETLDFAGALEQFPRYMRGERKVLYYLSKYPGNYANSLRLLPRGIAMMFIHAVQSQIFNEELEQRVRSGDFKSATYARSNFYGFPDSESPGPEGEFPLGMLVGYESRDEELGSYAKAAMERMQVSKEQFAIKPMPEIAMKGAYRTLLSPVKDISLNVVGPEVRLSFSLPKGAYATVLLDELIKEK
ncbi:MAG: tRNA pseudouridine(13) synthase TruD [Candidatus Micrarchaeota archaeon]|nr:tRNA pseudouridine(13) synthase TruD [Candidatus Micrarchaeota archaeon]